MSKLNNLQTLLEQEIKDLYSAETQLVKALPKMAKGASSEALKEAITSHLEETKGHVERLAKAAEVLGITPRGKTCKAMKGLIEEGAEALEEEGDPNLLDLAIIGAAQRVEHYEIAGYGCARALAEALGQDEIVDLLQATIDEEGAADKTLTGVAEQLMPMALEVGAQA
ncbi:ferritin-like domain-containing protein [Haloferula sp. BvORR071]|uniref:ferritin-like domain-containing protein n=1 Tax=Haloferula sp. BvORR071 TaxID=1396141 RepID=UPI000552F042|nr:ferritin-like domain-containing protein [Haloferula sp. BvORR071]